MINITKMTKENYYSIEEVAKLLKVAYLTVYRWVRAGKLIALKAGKQYRVTSSNLQNFLKYAKKK